MTTVQCSAVNRRDVQCKRRVPTTVTPAVCPAHMPKAIAEAAEAALVPPPESLYPKLGLRRFRYPDAEGRMILSEWTHDLGDEHARKILSGEIAIEAALEVERVTREHIRKADAAVCPIRKDKLRQVREELRDSILALGIRLTGEI